jgi:hypothetical protein
LGRIYSDYKQLFFPKLLQQDMPEENKYHLRELLHKPWNPYIRRHSALTQKSGILKEHHLRQYAGWSMNSKMVQRYVHYFGNESSNDLLIASGIIPNDKQQSDALKSKSCPNCNEPNKPHSKFCVKCRLLLSMDGVIESLESEKQKDSRIQALEAKINDLSNAYSTFANMVDPKQIVDAIHEGKFRCVAKTESEANDQKIVPGAVKIMLRKIDKGQEIQRN